MPSRFSGKFLLPRVSGAAAILLVAALGTTLLFRHTLDYGFDYDDYQFTKPFTTAEVRDAFHGPWDRTGIQVPFYRPLTIAFYAARFELLGLNSYAHHALSLVMFACAAALCGVFAWGATRRPAAGVAAALLFVVHPAMPYAQAAWPTNQMHLAGSLVVLAALVWWNFVRARPIVWWLPLAVAAVAAFMIKEDGVMLLPTIVALHWLRRRLVEPRLPGVPRAFLAIAAVLILALLALRTDALQGLGGYHRPTAQRALWNYTAGLHRVFRLVPADRPWQELASWIATVLPLAALVMWRRAAPDARFLLAGGVVVAVLFNLPFLFVTKLEQMHLVALGAALALAGSALAIGDPRRPRPVVVGVVFVVAICAAAMGAVARDISFDFDPFGPIVMAHDRIVEEWAAVPHELREYLAVKRQPGERPPANPVEAVDVVVFGAHPPEHNPAGRRIRWMASARTEILVTARARDVVIPLRHEARAFREPAFVEVVANGRRVDTLELRDGEWRMSHIALRRADARRFWRMHRIVLTLRRAWVPAQMIPGSADTRVLGLQIGDLQLK